MELENNFEEPSAPNSDEYNKKVQIDSVLNNKKNESVLSFKKLSAFLADYKIKKGETEDYANKKRFCDVYKKQVYYIPDNIIFNFMDLIEACRDDNLKLNFQEYQDERASGIMFDFDILMDSNVSVISKINFTDLIQMFFEIFVTILNFNLKQMLEDGNDSDSDPEYGKTHIQEDDVYSIVKHAVIIKKTKVVYKPDLQKYKDGFHLLFPNIKVSRKLKKYMIKRVLDCKAIIKLFKTHNLVLSEILDKNSASVPLFLFGSSKVGSEPYKLYKIYTGRLFYDYVSDVCEYEDKLDQFNLICEFSVNYGTNHGLIPKKLRYRQKSGLRNDVDLFNEHYKYEYENTELVELENDISLKNLYVPDINYVKEILTCLSIERISNYDTWIKLIFAISNLGSDCKSLAAWVSKRVPEKWDPSKFEEIWNNAINNKGDTENRLTIRSIIYWAKEDNLRMYNDITEKSIKDLINGDIFDEVLCGDIFPKQYAKYIHHMFSDKFITDMYQKDKEHAWFEFVLPTDMVTNKNIYKWRLEDKSPDSLLIYMNEKMVIVLREILNDISTRINNEGDEAIIKYLTIIKKNFIRSIKKLFTPMFKQQIIKEAALYFRQRGFIEDLDKDKNLLGVDNGVLDLSEVKLIETYHRNPITHSTGVRYIPYNKKNKYIKRVEKTIRNLFPDNEMDAHDFIMYYIASCLDGRPKQSMILIITGVGCHAVDTEIRMFDNSIKKVQDVIVGDLLMGDDNTSREVQELFRGRDQMVKITPNNSDSFVVNVNHILSLRFNNIGPKYIIKDDEYQVVWYVKSCDDYDYEPIKRVETFTSKDMAKDAIFLLNQRNDVIKEKQIIDIKISKLTNWNKWWLIRGNLVLYKINQIISTFTMEFIGEDNYYGFELDDNHRYQTADFFIHHNSNGKSFFFEFAKSILGPKYGIKMELAFLTDKRKKSAGADTALMMLEHARLCHYSETEQNEELNTARVKEITGQESLAGRNLYESQRNFRPAAHHLITCNHHLNISTTDHGTWRRIKTYKFKILFTSDPDEDNPNERLLDPKVAEEYATDDQYKEAFLSILVEYYKELQSKYDGNILNINCKSIDKETNEYRHNEDIVSAFIDSRTIIATKNSQNISEIVEIYKRWYQANISATNLTTNIQQLNNIILNSKLCKYFKLENKTYTLKGLKVLDTGEEIEEDEKYWSNPNEEDED